MGRWAMGSTGCDFITTNFSNSTNTKICTELSPRLSIGASIIFPENELFEKATQRWQKWQEPKFTVVVIVRTESDVQETVRFASNHDIPFLAFSGGHGAIDSLGSMDHGIQIRMTEMKSVSISPDGQSATIGGGILSKDLVDTLWASKKQTVTGCCECVSLIGPLLGGGHGFLQGYHGLVGDSMISARVVLANGSAVTASAESHPDLFWGLRGAGHNFGIVTEFIHKLYDVPPNDKWATKSYIFTGDKVEKIFEASNALMGNQPPGLIAFSFFAWLPSVDPTAPVVFSFILYHGSESELSEFSVLFDKIESSVPVNTKLVDYTELASLTGNGYDGLACGYGSVSLRFPIGAKKYDIKTQRAVYDKFAQVTTEIPALNGSVFLFEGYSTQGVKAVSEKSTAFPHRLDNLLIAPVMVYEPNKTLDPIAIQAGKDIRNMIYDGEGRSEFHAYVNYAHGDESLQEMYGYEEWRVEKLRHLKSLYDSEGRFNFYAPIEQPASFREEV
ncbi:putative FAD-dependent oxygenase [Rhexocercosporidium sp. MPI-PUGE-AT-0058]|nr:putative FAD-dependent oxygenase [Rhexocercosporidium sp. MPI-PUGE-AT-0058]